jgi:hypothetical protein
VLEVVAVRELHDLSTDGVRVPQGRHLDFLFVFLVDARRHVKQGGNKLNFVQDRELSATRHEVDH